MSTCLQVKGKAEVSEVLDSIILVFKHQQCVIHPFIQQILGAHCVGTLYQALGLQSWNTAINQPDLSLLPKSFWSAWEKERTTSIQQDQYRCAEEYLLRSGGQSSLTQKVCRNWQAKRTRGRRLPWAGHCPRSEEREMHIQVGR